MKKTILSALMLTSLAGAAQAQVVYNFTTQTANRITPDATTIVLDDAFIAKTLTGANTKINLNSVTVGIRRVASTTTPAPATDVSVYAAEFVGNTRGGASVGTPVLLGTVSLPARLITDPSITQLVTIGTTIPFVGQSVFTINGNIPQAPLHRGFLVGVQLSNAAGNNGWRIVSGGTVGANFLDLFYQSLNAAPVGAYNFTDPTVPNAFFATVNGTFSDPATSDPKGQGVAVPARIDNDLSSTVVFRVNTIGGFLPSSTGLGVVLDASALSAGSITLLDDGVAPDVTAGDGIFTVSVALAANQIVGVYQLPFTVTETDPAARFGTGNIAFTVTDANGSCCLNGGATCEILLPSACAAQLGTFNGAGSTCSTPDTYTASSAAAAFEDISATGTTFIPDTGNTDDGSQNVALPFANGFNFYGTSFFATFVNNNGALSFFNAIGNAGFVANIIPSAAVPNGAVFGWWHDLDVTPVTGGGTLQYESRGTAGVDQRFIAQWTNVPEFGFLGTTSNTFQIVLFENGNSAIRYGVVTPAATDAAVTVGIEDSTGAIGTNIPSTGIGAGNTTRRLTFVQATQACFCTADVNKDGVVDGQDFIDFINAFGVGDVTVDNKADVNKDLIIDGGDFILFINSFGAGC